MNVKVTMAKLQKIIKEELDMIDVTDDIIEEDDEGSPFERGEFKASDIKKAAADEKAFKAFKSVIKTLRSDVFPKLNEEELYAFGQQMYRFFESYKS